MIFLEGLKNQKFVSEMQTTWKFSGKLSIISLFMNLYNSIVSEWKYKYSRVFILGIFEDSFEGFGYYFEGRLGCEFV